MKNREPPTFESGSLSASICNPVQYLSWGTNVYKDFRFSYGRRHYFLFSYCRNDFRDYKKSNKEIYYNAI